MVPAYSHRVSRVPWYSGSCSVPSDFAYGAFTLSGRPSQDRSAIFRKSGLQSEPRHARMTVWALPVSLAATPGIDFSFFSSGYLDVSVRRVPSVCLWIQHTVMEGCSIGFPHSDICGSQPICGSPQLFAAYHVFLRPLVPRHPPRALFCLTVWLFAFPFTLSVALLGVLLLFGISVSNPFLHSHSPVLYLSVLFILPRMFCLISFFANSR